MEAARVPLAQRALAVVVGLAAAAALLGALRGAAVPTAVAGTVALAAVVARAALTHLELRRHRDALARSEARARTLEAQVSAVLAGSRDLVLLVGADGAIRYANAASRAVLGVEPEQLQRRPVVDLVEPAVRPGFQAALDDLVRTGTDQPVRTARCATADGHVILEVVAAWSPELDGVVMNLRDVTERDEALHALRRSEADLTALVEYSPDAIERYDRDLARTFANPVARHAFDLGSAPGRLVPDAVARVLRSGQRHQVQVVDRHGGTWDALLVPEPGPDGTCDSVLVVARDVSARVRAEEAVHHAASHDPLTGLPNRRLLVDRLDQATARAAREGSTVALLFLDLDHFKAVNDSLGHAVGDELLVAASARLISCSRGGDTVARLGGDEFVVLAEGLDGPADVVELASRLVAEFERPFPEAGGMVLTASIGTASATGTAAQGADLLRDADAAMYERKRSGRNGATTFDQRLRAKLLHRVGMEGALRRAIDRDELVLWYQPVLEVATGATRRVEALLRWQHPERGLLGPGEFLAIGDETGLAAELCRWVLTRALADRRHHGHDVGVNVSAKALTSRLAAHLEPALRHPGQGRLWLEVGEGSLVGPDLDVLWTARRLGALVAIDDVGVGYAAVGRMGQLPADELKVDRSFVAALGTDPHAAALVRTVAGLAARWDLPVVAQGVETPAQLRAVIEAGCHAAQGFLLAPPVPVEELDATVALAAERLGHELDALGLDVPTR